MTKREALRKLKNYWVSNGGADYLDSLHRLREEIDHLHPSRPSLDAEIRQIEEVHPDFLAWQKTTVAKRKLMRAFEEQVNKDIDDAD